MTRKRDFTGERFGRLVVIGEAPKRPTSPNAVVHVRCDCGAETEAFTHNLVAKRTLSCGCLRTERLAETADKRIAAVKEFWRQYREGKK